MPQRNVLFQKFGPIIMEAFMLMTLDAVNALRARAGLAQHSKQRVIDEINNHLSTLEPYDWMKERP